MKTLVVEDDPVFSDVLATALRRRGFDVSVALSCEQAAALINESRPDLAVVDWPNEGKDEAGKDATR